MTRDRFWNHGIRMKRTLPFAALCGATLGLHVAAYARLVPFWSDGSPRGASLALGLVLVGLVVGITVGRRLMRDRADPPGAMALLPVALFAWLAGAPLLLPGRIVAGLTSYGGQMPVFGRFLWWQTRLLGGALLPAALLAGCGWALLCGVAGRRGGLVLAGGLLAGMFAARGLLPAAWGVEAALRAALITGALSAGAALAWAMRAKPRLAWAAYGLPPLLALVGVLGLSGRAPMLSEHWVGCWIGTRGALVRYPGAITAHHDDRRQTLTLREFPEGGRLLCRDGERLLAQPGDLPTAVLAVQLPLLLHPAPRRLALLGIESGEGIAAAADHPLESMACMGLGRPQLAAIRPLLADGRGREAVLDDPRVSFTAEEPRALLRERAGRYDVIVLHAAPPWRTEGARALTRASFADCRGALATNGILCVPIDVQHLAPRQMRRIAGSFADVFPRMQVWSPQFNRLLLIGTVGERAFEAGQLLARLEQRKVMRSLARVGVMALPDLLACLVMTPSGVKRYLSPDAGARNRFSGLRLAWDAARDRWTPDANLRTLAEIEAARTWRLDRLQPGGLDPELFQALQERVVRQMAARAAVMEMRVSRAADSRAETMRQARAAARLNPGDAFLSRLLLAMEQEGAYALARRDYAGAARLYGEVLGILRERASAHYGAAMADRGLGRQESAYQHLRLAVAAEPDARDCRLALAEAAFATGRETEALRQYQTLLERRAGDPETLIGLAICLGRGKPPVRNIAQAIVAAERAAERTRYRDPSITSVLADLYVENGRVLEGVSLKRRIRLARQER
jgi:spermidine synthase/tetratricopeptide (TPR) repeat protein